MQVKQKDKVGRPDIDAFETAMRRAKSEKGFFVSFDYSGDALREIDRFFREEHKIIVVLTVREILEEEIAIRHSNVITYPRPHRGKKTGDEAKMEGQSRRNYSFVSLRL